MGEVRRRMAVVGMLVAAACPQAASAQDYGGSPQQGAGALNRFYNASTKTHSATPGPVAAGFAYEVTLGYLLPGGGSSRHAIYGCRSGAVDYFLSFDAGCEGTTSLGRYGFAYVRRPTASTPSRSGAAFGPGSTTSSRYDPGARATRPRAAWAFSRAAATRSCAATAAQPIVTPSPPARPPAASATSPRWASCSGSGGATGSRSTAACAPGSDYFLSLDSGCEGQAGLGREGYAYTLPPTSEQTVALYRCVVPRQHHFASNDPNCEGQRTEGRLGFLRALRRRALPVRQPRQRRPLGDAGRAGPRVPVRAHARLPRRSGGPNLARSTAAARAPPTTSSRSTPAARPAPRSAATALRSRARPPTSRRSRCIAARGRVAGTSPRWTPTARGVLSEGLLGYIRTLDSGPPPAPSCSASGALVEDDAARPQEPHGALRARRDAIGRAVRPDGSPAAGSEVLVLEGGGPLAEVGRAVAGPDGGFGFRVPPRRQPHAARRLPGRRRRDEALA